MFVTSSAPAGSGTMNPNMVQSQVIQNARLDRTFVNWRRSQKQYYSPFEDTNADEVFDLKAREMCFTVKRNYDRFIQRNIAPDKDHELRVFSSANGVPDFFSSMQSRRYDIGNIRDAVSFVGVPLVDIRTANENQTDAVAVMVSGSTTIFNTGPFDITVGDMILWDLPFSGSASRQQPTGQIYGIVEKKKLFMTVPLRFALLGSQTSDPRFPKETGGEIVQGLFDKLQKFDPPSGKAARIGDGTEYSKHDERITSAWKALYEDARRNAGDEDKFEDSMRGLLAGWTGEWEALMKRKIGYALSSARPNQQFDVLLSK